MLTSASPRNSATVVAISKYTIALTPMRPIALRSPVPVMPTTSVAKTSGAMIKMIIAPLVFATLVVGIAGTGDLKAMGRIGVKAIVYFEIATTVALFLGLALVNIFQPGAGLP